VADTGIGIPEHLHQEIFKEFFQIGNPERDRTQGLGLGLAIVQRLSRLLRCPVTVRSREGRGATFGVDIPLVGFNKTINVVPLRRSSPEQPPTGNGLVFVIDDEPSVLKGLRLAIENWGYTVLTARSELEAISLLNGRPQAPDIIIADYRLRSICNGAQVVAHIRETFGSQVPCILITGDTAPERIREAHDHGFTLLHKPVEPGELRAAIAETLSRQAASDASAG
jgi:two-component system, sensor histidine kinase